MPVFVAVIARTRHTPPQGEPGTSERALTYSWRALDIDVTDMVDLEHLASSLDRFALSAVCVMVLIEGESWFGLASVHDGEATVFASELDSAVASACGDLFQGLTANETYGWAGDPALLEYFGVPGELVQEAAETGMDPELALTDIAEHAGCAVNVDALR